MRTWPISEADHLPTTSQADISREETDSGALRDELKRARQELATAREQVASLTAQLTESTKHTQGHGITQETGFLQWKAKRIRSGQHITPTITNTERNELTVTEFEHVSISNTDVGMWLKQLERCMRDTLRE